MWLNLAAANAYDAELGIKASDARDRLAARMTAGQIAEAQKLAREWKPLSSGQQADASRPFSPERVLTPQIISGSGLFVSHGGDILTNAHVVEGCKAAEVTVRGETVPAVIVARDKQIDLALLAAPLEARTTLPLRLTVRQGEAIYTYGFPLAGLLSSGGNFTVGSVTALAGLHDDSRSIQISAPVQPGNSGEPLLDEAGNLVGVVVAKLDALRVAHEIDDVPQNVNFAIKSGVIADFLSAHAIEFTQGRFGPRLNPSDIADRARAFTVFIRCEQETTVNATK
jgi:S1-C subfamily serine protease